MEYVAGPSLRTVLRETKGPIPVHRALQIARGVAAGLSAAHARGAVHRDIKPENVLLRIEASGEIQPKVLDFGIAAMAESITALSLTHGLLLTPQYAAPEQWRGMSATEIDGRADLYALGGILYEMLAGRTPFRAESPEGWMYQHLQCTPEPLAALRPDLVDQYPGLDAIVLRLLAREREHRPPGVSQFLAALDRVETKPSPWPVEPPAPPSEARQELKDAQVPPVSPTDGLIWYSPSELVAPGPQVGRQFLAPRTAGISGQWAGPARSSNLTTAPFRGSTERAGQTNPGFHPSFANVPPKVVNSRYLLNISSCRTSSMVPGSAVSSSAAAAIASGKRVRIWPTIATTFALNSVSTASDESRRQPDPRPY